MERKLIGLSLSRCLIDILLGNVILDEVSAIVSSTAFETMQDAYYSYKYLDWQHYDPGLVYKTLQEVWPFVCQPRLQLGLINHGGHYITGGIWYDSKTGKSFNFKESYES